MDCYFDRINQFYTMGGLILLTISLGANVLTCAYCSKKSTLEEPLITSANYINGDSDLERGELSDVETESKSTNTSPHVCSVRRYTPVWSASHERMNNRVAHKAKLPDWVMKEYMQGKQERESL